MPFIRVTMGGYLEVQEKRRLEQRLTEVMEVIPGKGEWVMISIDEGKVIYFKGSSEPSAMVEIHLFGNVNSVVYDELTERITQLIASSTSISPERVYITYQTTPYWGWNCKNF